VVALSQKLNPSIGFLRVYYGGMADQTTPPSKQQMDAFIARGNELVLANDKLGYKQHMLDHLPEMVEMLRVSAERRGKGERGMNEAELRAVFTDPEEGKRVILIADKNGDKKLSVEEQLDALFIKEEKQSELALKEEKAEPLNETKAEPKLSSSEQWDKLKKAAFNHETNEVSDLLESGVNIDIKKNGQGIIEAMIDENAVHGGHWEKVSRAILMLARRGVDLSSPASDGRDLMEHCHANDTHYSHMTSALIMGRAVSHAIKGDLNKDGLISTAELNTIMSDRGRAQEFLKGIDLNGDDKISKEESETFIRKSGLNSSALASNGNNGVENASANMRKMMQKYDTVDGGLAGTNISFDKDFVEPAQFAPSSQMADANKIAERSSPDKGGRA